MKLKPLFFSLILSTGLLSCSLPVSAQITEAEMSEITEAMKLYDEDYDTVSEENIYKSYALDGLYREDYYNAENFESLISGEVRTYVRVGDTLITLLNRNGKLEAVGETLQLGGLSVIELKEESLKIAQTVDEEIADTKFCHFSMLRLSVIYYKTVSGNEFVVPYINDAYGEYTGIIENGKLYSTAEFLNQMKLIFNISNYNPYELLGVPDTYIIGDANSDYSVDVRDCSYIAKMLSSNRPGMLRDVCDYNKDGNKNVRDAAAIARILALN